MSKFAERRQEVEKFAAQVAAETKHNSKKELTPAQIEGRDATIEDIRQNIQSGVRTSYSALATSALEHGWVEPSNISLGQRGSGLLKQIPQHLHFALCRTNGKYDKKAEGNLLPTIKEDVIQAGTATAEEIEGLSSEDVFAVVTDFPVIQADGEEIRDPLAERKERRAAAKERREARKMAKSVVDNI